jgi:hypothetical protein
MHDEAFLVAIERARSHPPRPSPQPLLASEPRPRLPCPIRSRLTRPRNSRRVS